VRPVQDNTLEAIFAALEEADTHKVIEIGEPIDPFSIPDAR
jgi:hypothetical protein